MSVLDTIDYLKPSPGGAKLLINDGVNLLTAGGTYVSAWVDVTAFSGLFVQWNGFDLAGDFGTLQVLFRDSLAGQVLEPAYTATWRGDLPGELNVPVLGAQAQVKVIGPAHVVNGQLEVTGHGGGPGTQVALASKVLTSLSPGALAVGATVTAQAPTITEGAALLYFAAGSQPGIGYVTAADSSGVVTIIGGFSMAANQQDVRRLWLPPQPVILNVANSGPAVGNYNATLTKERS